MLFKRTTFVQIFTKFRQHHRPNVLVFQEKKPTFTLIVPSPQSPFLILEFLLKNNKKNWYLLISFFRYQHRQTEDHIHNPRFLRKFRASSFTTTKPNLLN
ncbi:hypothetical protein FRX31_029378 [Thalictrum thalictroides]|uniref:Uncharacterized protein n=1 Tax=Thalictrum thalictroides TaxID=46969 RepID=A0A7J6V8D3_THATH|nr:hypothetical protein FRX31_029378 [Thalictrum thalictroides]